jgi:hypothetical protein
MKTFITLLVAAGLISACGVQRDVQVQAITAELIKIDTVYRTSSNPQRVLTWRDDNNITYISYTTLFTNYYIGTRVPMLVRR